MDTDEDADELKDEPDKANLNADGNANRVLSPAPSNDADGSGDQDSNMDLDQDPHDHVVSSSEDTDAASSSGGEDRMPTETELQQIRDRLNDHHYYNEEKHKKGFMSYLRRKISRTRAVPMREWKKAHNAEQWIRRQAAISSINSWAEKHCRDGDGFAIKDPNNGEWVFHTIFHRSA